MAGSATRFENCNEEAMAERRKDFVSLPHDQFGELLESSAEKGAAKALAKLGLDDAQAATDIREGRLLLDSYREARRTAVRTFVAVVLSAVLGAIWWAAKAKGLAP